jgi:hypothetical protein
MYARGDGVAPGSANGESESWSAGRRARGRGAGRVQHSGSSRATFYGREVSIAHATTHGEPHADSGVNSAEAHPGEVASSDARQQEAPSGSRRYLASRGDASQGGIAPAQPGQVAGEHVQMAVPNMVPIQPGMQQAQVMHLNPNAPGFLPLGGGPPVPVQSGAHAVPQGPNIQGVPVRTETAAGEISHTLLNHVQVKQISRGTGVLACLI